ncbi:MAG: chalcone isomerase family protein [Pseudomonadota bacterium]
MKKLLSISVLALSTFAMTVQAAPATLSANGVKLVKNGEGTRSVFGMKVYRGALYLKSKSNNAVAIVKADEPMAIHLDVTSSLITKDKMKKVVYEGFAKSTGSKTAMRPQVDKLLNVFGSGIKKGDKFTLVYTPGKGVVASKNGKAGSVVPGVKFKQALFGVWIGAKPAQSSLKKAMLGQ